MELHFSPIYRMPITYNYDFGAFYDWYLFIEILLSATAITHVMRYCSPHINDWFRLFINMWFRLFALRALCDIFSPTQRPSLVISAAFRLSIVRFLGDISRRAIANRLHWYCADDDLLMLATAIFRHRDRSVCRHFGILAQRRWRCRRVWASWFRFRITYWPGFIYGDFRFISSFWRFWRSIRHNNG